MEIFAATVNGFKSLNTVAKFSVVGFFGCPGYASDLMVFIDL